MGAEPFSGTPGRFGEFADPLSAHLDYDDDERVISMIAHGLGPGRTRPIVEERCSFTRTINEFGTGTTSPQTSELKIRRDFERLPDSRVAYVEATLGKPET